MVIQRQFPASHPQSQCVCRVLSSKSFTLHIFRVVPDYLLKQTSSLFALVNIRVKTTTSKTLLQRTKPEEYICYFIFLPKKYWLMDSTIATSNTDLKVVWISNHLLEQTDKLYIYVYMYMCICVYVYICIISRRFKK